MEASATALLRPLLPSYSCQRQYLHGCSRWSNDPHAAVSVQPIVAMQQDRRSMISFCFFLFFGSMIVQETRGYLFLDLVVLSLLEHSKGSPQ